MPVHLQYLNQEIPEDWYILYYGIEIEGSKKSNTYLNSNLMIKNSSEIERV